MALGFFPRGLNVGRRAGRYVSVFAQGEQACKVVDGTADIENDQVGVKTANPVLVPQRLFRDRASGDAGVDDLERLFPAILLRSLLKNGLQLERIGIDVVGAAAKGEARPECDNSEDTWVRHLGVDLLTAEALRTE